MLLELLHKKQQELAAEEAAVAAILKECAREKVNPAKDYWHQLYQLRSQVTALERMMREGIG